MGFITAAVIAGVGIAGYGVSQQMKAAKSQESAQREIVEQQQQQERLRQRQMELEGRRKSMEVLRNQQRVRSMSLATATAQGASKGSGLPGAYGQFSGQAGGQLLGIGQNLDIGRQMFASNVMEGNARMAYAGAQAQYAMGAGLTSLGGMLVSNAGTIGALGKEFGGMASRAGGYAMYGTNPGTGSGGGVNPYYR